MLALKSSSTERSLCRLSMIYIFITLLQSLSFAIEDSLPLRNSGLKAMQTPRKSDTGLQSPTLMQIEDTAVCGVDVGCFKTTQNIEVKFRQTEDETGVEFQIKCQTPGGWCSMGFGRNAKNMSPASVIDCLRFANGDTDVRMSYNGPGQTENNVPLNDITLANYITVLDTSYVGGVLTCNFVRLFDANGNTNNNNIYSLNTESYYLLLGKGLRMNQLNAQKERHEDDPEISPATVNVKFTPQSLPTDSLTSQSLQTDSFTSQSISTIVPPTSGINGKCDVDVGCFDSKEGVSLRYLKTSDGKSVEFLITCNVETSGWCSVGFANNRDMSPASVLDCMLYSNSKGAKVELSYNGPGEDNNPLPDTKKYITTLNTEHKNGDLTCNFLRPIDVSGDNYGNKIFNLNTPYYLLLGKGTLADQTTGKKNRHGEDPEVSATKVDVQFIPQSLPTDSLTSQSTATIGPPTSGINGVCGVDVGCFNSVEGVRLRYLKTSDGKSVEFLITCNVQTSGWCSVGFANNRDMSPASVLDCMLYSNEKGAKVELSYNGPGEDNDPLPDTKKYITTLDVGHNNGDLTCNFLRPIDVSGDNYGNKIFNLNTPYYLLLGKGTLADQTTGKKNRHGKDPEVSKDKRDVSFIPSETETSHGVSTLPFLRAQGVLMLAAWVLLRNGMCAI